MCLDEFDKQFYNEGYKFVVGVDEAGRGPLAGPVYAAAVILPEDFYIPEINDSKKLTEKKREMLFDIIIENALSYSIESVNSDVIDEINILNATLLAMKNAVCSLKLKPDLAIVDGNKTKDLPVEARCIIKGDAKSQSIAAASILAKVARDKYCREHLDVKYPEYNFSKHKGYGTKLHIEKLKKIGPSKKHKKSFYKKILD